MQVKNQMKRITDKKGKTKKMEDLEFLNEKRKLQNKVLQKLIENLTKEVPKNKKAK
jgi:hypothetical protein